MKSSNLCKFKKSGYSILEILLCLSMSLVILALTLPAFDLYKNYKLKMQAYVIALAIRSAQTKAINEGITYTVKFANFDSLDDCPYYSVYSVNDKKQIKNYLGGGMKFLKSDSQYIIFRPNAYIDKGLTVIIANRSKYISISINPCVGRVRIST